MKTIILVLSLCLFAVSAQTATLVWNGSVNGFWETESNWTPAAVPRAGDALIFPGATPNDITTNNFGPFEVVRLDSIVFFGPTTIRVSNSSIYPKRIDAFLESGTVKVDFPTYANQGLSCSVGSGAELVFFQTIFMGARGTLTLSSAATGLIRVAGAIQGSGNIVTEGPGTVRMEHLTLSSAEVTNTVNGGTLELAEDSSFAIIGPLIIGDGFGGPNADVVRLSRGPIAVNGIVTVNSSGLLDLNGYNNLLNGLTINSGHVTTGTGAASFGSLYASGGNPTAARIDGNLDTSGPLQHSIIITDNPSFFGELEIWATIRGTGNLFKHGTGELVLNGANLYTGPTVIDQGILVANHNAALGSTIAGTTVNNGATLLLGAYPSVVAEPLTLNGPGFGGTNGALAAVGVTTASANVVLQSPSTIRTEASAQFSVAGLISGTGPLTKTGTGLLLMAGDSNNTYTGDTLVQAGYLYLNKNPDAVSIPGHLVIGSGAPSGPTATVRHLIGNTINGGITVNRGGLYDLNGQNESFVFALLGGRSPLTLNDGGDVQTANGRLFLPAGTTVVVEPGLNGSSSIDGRVALEASLAFGGNHTFSVNSPISTFAGTPLTISASLEAISSTAHVIKTGPGEMRLSGNNTYTGQLAVNGGRVTLASSGAAGASGGGVIVNSNAVLAIDGSLTINNETLTLNSTSPAPFAVLSGASIWNSAAAVNLNRNATIAVNASSSLEVYGAISGPGTLTKTGPGTLYFKGSTANTYTNTTWVNEGTLVLNNTFPNRNRAIVGPLIIGDGVGGTYADLVRLERVRQIGNTVPVTIQSSGLLFIVDGLSDAFGALAGSGNVVFEGTGDLEVGLDDGSSTFSGVITGGGNFWKHGLGTMTLNGDNTYTGATIIEGGGKLVVNGSQPLSPVTVSNNATLGGDGVVGHTTVYSGGLLAPSSKFRDHQGGELETGNLNLNAGAVLSLSYFGPSGPGGNDSVTASGTVALTNATLAAGFFYAPRQGDVLPVITRRSFFGAVAGTFAGLGQNAITLVSNIPCRISYTGGIGNNVTLTVTNLALGASRTRVESGNGNALVEPDECNLLFLTLTNRRNTALTVSKAVLRAVTPGAVVTIAEAAYSTVPALGATTNATPFQLRTLPDLICGGPVTVELQVTVAGEGTFAVLFTLPGGTDCANNGGGCESCTAIAGGRITNGLPTLAQRLYRTADASACFPAKKSPGPDPVPNNPVRYATHSFTNATANEICVTALLDTECVNAAQTLMAVAVLDAFNPANLYENYLGDTPGLSAGLASPFSFRVPAGARFVIVVNEVNAGLGCPNYTLELYGLRCPPPSLHIAKGSASAKVHLHWSTASPGWQLQSVNTLNGPPPYPFANVPAASAVVNSQYTVTNNAPGVSQFYRLKQ